MVELVFSALSSFTRFYYVLLFCKSVVYISVGNQFPL